MSDSNGEFVFHGLAPKLQRVTIDDRKFILREASEDAANAYQDELMRDAEIDMNSGEVIRMSQTPSRSQSVLLSRCLFEIIEEVDDSSVDAVDLNNPVGLDFVLNLPNRISKPLIKWVRRHSDLTLSADEAETLGKNEPSAAVDG